ncbi:MAG: cytochrome c, partial [Aureliella sp.]
ENSATDPSGWHNLISATSLEDLLKASKLRLDKIVTTMAAFKGGGFVEARTEFSLQALLFAIIETYPSDVRWKNSAAEARIRMARVAANTKIGSDQVFTEAKARLLDLGDLLGGTSLSARSDEATEIDWSHLIDRVPLMKLLDWAHEKNLSKLVASESQFKDSSDDVLRYAELIAVLGQVALAEEMPDASDGDYAALARAMIAAAQQVALAAKTGNAELARSAAGQIGQTCTNCHDSFR